MFSNVSLAQCETPFAVLREDVLVKNIHHMQRWIDKCGFALAPHGKTTMAPAIWHQQIDHGAWGITIATEAQLWVALEHKFNRVMMANPLVRPQAVAKLSQLRDEDDDIEVLTWVDSKAAVKALGGSRRRPLKVLVDVGHHGGRTGARSDDEIQQIIKEIEATQGVVLAGTTGYEGAVEGDGDHRDHIVAYLQRLVDVHMRLVKDRCEQPFFSVGGSDNLPLLAVGLADVADLLGTVLIRSGMYILHDHGLYEKRQLQNISTFDSEAEGYVPQFEPALFVIGTVLSVQDEGVAILDIGRRDVGHDHGLPQVLALWGKNGSTSEPQSDSLVAEIHDQHAFVPKGTFAVKPCVGDRIVLGVSHTCTTMDKWRTVGLVSGPVHADSQIVGTVPTYF